MADQLGAATRAPLLASSATWSSTSWRRAPIASTSAVRRPTRPRMSFAMTRPERSTTASRWRTFPPRSDRRAARAASVSYGMEDPA